jgi:hypothetical protein
MTNQVHSDEQDETTSAEVVEKKASPVAKAPGKKVKKIVKVSAEKVEPVVAAPAVVASAAPVAPVPTKDAHRFQASGRVKVIQGSILAPHNAGLRFVLNIANMSGKAESPLYPLFDKKWKKVKEEVKGWFNTRTGAYKLGAVNTVPVQSDTWVINLLCQDEEFKTDTKGLTTCLKEVCKMAKYEKATVHISTLLTQAVPEITDLLNNELVEQGVSVYFYEEPKP